MLTCRAWARRAFSRARARAATSSRLIARLAPRTICGKAGLRLCSRLSLGLSCRLKLRLLSRRSGTCRVSGAWLCGWLWRYSGVRFSSSSTLNSWLSRL
ncbi:hypothetical protein D3C78_1573280 [compost metagenome]